MAKVFEHRVNELAKKSGYSYDDLVDVWNDHLEETGEFPDWNYFSRVSMEHDW